MSFFKSESIEKTELFHMKVFEKEEKELWVAFHQLLLSLPYTEECTEWLTQFAFHGGKTGHNLYKVKINAYFPSIHDNKK